MTKTMRKTKTETENKSLPRVIEKLHICRLTCPHLPALLQSFVTVQLLP